MPKDDSVGWLPVKGAVAPEPNADVTPSLRNDRLDRTASGFSDGCSPRKRSYEAIHASVIGAVFQSSHNFSNSDLV